jgi:SNF2 family DNA or RNA helicase
MNQNVILHPKGHMLLATKQVETLKTFLPTMNIFPTPMPNGDWLCAIPHRWDEFQVLKNLGIEGPSLLTNWKYTGRFTPRSYQEETTALMVHNKVGYVFDETGMGKTSASIWAAEYLFQQDKIDAVLVLSTLSSLEPTWANEIWNTAPHRTSVVIHDNNPDMKVKLAQQDVHFYIMNHDGFKLDYINDIFMKSKKRWMVIVDEATKFKSRKSDRHKALARFFRKHDPIRVAMTATPMPNGPDDAYGLAMLMYPTGAKMSYMQFKDATQFKISNFKWVNKKGWEQIAHSLLQPAVLHRKRDYLHELPPITYEDYYVPMSPSIRKAYDAVFSDFVYAEGDEDGSRSVTAINAAAKLVKLLQICCGSVIDDEREIMELDASKKNAVLDDVLEKAPGKLIVYVPFKAALSRVAAYIESKGKSVAVVCGDVAKGERDRIFKEMQRGELQVIVGQPESMAHSITLTEASDIVWYGPITNAETYLQANGRIERLGQQNPMTVHHLYSSNAERKIYDLLKNKEMDQTSLLNLYLEEAKERK